MQEPLKYTVILLPIQYSFNPYYLKSRTNDPNVFILKVLKILSHW